LPPVTRDETLQEGWDRGQVGAIATRRVRGCLVGGNPVGVGLLVLAKSDRPSELEVRLGCRGLCEVNLPQWLTTLIEKRHSHLLTRRDDARRLPAVAVAATDQLRCSSGEERSGRIDDEPLAQRLASDQ